MLSTAISNLKSKSNSNSENELVLALESLRSSLLKPQIATFIYKPLVGIATRTDPNGYKVQFEYDGLNRLRDGDNNILNESEYNYILP